MTNLKSKIEADKKCCEDATSGPWIYISNDRNTIIQSLKPRKIHSCLFLFPFKEYHEDKSWSEQDAELIIRARTRWPKYIEALEAAIRVLSDIRDAQFHDPSGAAYQSIKRIEEILGK